MNSSRSPHVSSALRFASSCAALISLSLLAAWPLLRAGYPTIGDGLNHFYRLVEFDHLVRHGVWYPRWATDFGYGYGYPLFNFYPPLVYYLGALAHACGLGYAAALSSVYVAAIAAAVSGAYVLARQHWHTAGSLIAAAAYSLSPYLYFNLLARGALPETFGLGLLPWTLWAYYRLSRKPTGGRLLTATLLYSALWLSHLLSALLAWPLILLFVFIAGHPPHILRLVSRLWRSRLLPFASRRRRRTFSFLSLLVYHSLPPLLSLVLAVSLSAFFLIPAILETAAVQTFQLTLPADLDYHNNFLSLAQLFAAPQTFDPRLVFVAVSPSLSLAALALAIAGLLPALWRRSPAARNFRHWDLSLGLSLLGLCFLTMPFSVGLWEKFSSAAIIQFPWRLVGPASLLLALLAGGSCRLLTSGQISTVDTQRRSSAARFFSATLLFPSLGLCILWLHSLTWSFAAYPPAPVTATVRDLAIYEAAAGQLGTTSAAEFLPRTVQQLPPANSLAGYYTQKNVIDRLAPLPSQVTLISQSATPVSAAAVISSAEPVTLTFNVFFFPGWQATVDSRAVPVTASAPHGFITVPVPAGRHTVSIQFGSTPPRDLGTALSLLAFLGLIACAFRLRPSAPNRAVSHSPPAVNPAMEQPVLPRVLFGVVSLVLLVLRGTLIDGRATVFCHSRFDGAAVAKVDQTFDVNFGNQLVLIGLDRPHAAIAADQTVPLTLYWRAQTSPAADYSTTVQVLDAAGNLVGQSDSQNPGRLPTSRWRLDQYARDEHRLSLFAGTPPGTYRLVAGVYQLDGPALDILDENQIAQGQLFTLGYLTVSRARRPPAELGAAHQSDLALGPLILAGWTLDNSAPQAGDEIRLTLFWRAAAETRPNLSMRVSLSTTSGLESGVWKAHLTSVDYPASLWTANEIVRSSLRLRLPADISAGPAVLQIALTDTAGAVIAGPLALTALDLHVPQRSFVIPAIAYPRADTFGEAVRLLGYDQTDDSVTLYWQALAPMSVSYTVFVHALSADGRIMAQADSVPLGGNRPTTGWLPGEVLTDTYNLPLGGASRIEVGIYDAASTVRLGTATLEGGE